MPAADKNFVQKTVTIYFGKIDSYLSRAVTVLARKEGLSASDLMKMLFMEHCETVGLYRAPTEEGGVASWNKGKIEKLEVRYGKSKKKKLSKDFIPDED